MRLLTVFLARAALTILAAIAAASCDRVAGPPVDGNSASDAATAATKDTAGGAAKAAPATPPAQPPAPTTASLVTLPAAPPSDAQITAGAARALRNEPALAGADLSVSTEHGVVSLTGTVRSPEQVAVAEARAQVPAGVMRVDSRVTIAPER